MKEKKNRVGERWMTNEGYWVTITEDFGWHNCTIQFEDGTTLKNRQHGDIKRGEIKNPLFLSVCGIGFIGIGCYSKITHPKIYARWTDMIFRCYSKKEQLNKPSYIGCSVDESWHNFQIFGDWFEENYKEGFELDKDILFKGNNIYSPETCVFVPQKINILLVKQNSRRGKYPIGVYKNNGRYKANLNKGSGVRKYLGYYGTPEEAFEAYKVAKEEYIKELANLYREQITERCYNALMNYVVEITD